MIPTPMTAFLEENVADEVIQVRTLKDAGIWYLELGRNDEHILSSNLSGDD